MFSKVFRQNHKIINSAFKVYSRKKGDLAVIQEMDQLVPAHTCELFDDEDIARYRSRLPEITKLVFDQHADLEMAMDRFATQINRLLPNDMLVEGLKIAGLYKSIVASTHQEESEERTKNAEILGWCADLMICSMQINDDIMEDATTRWGNPCYHMFEDVGMLAVNDAVYIENLVYFLLKNFFYEKPWYADCTDLFHDVSLKTAMGQSFEECVRCKGNIQFQLMTMNNYLCYARYKGSYPAVRLPLMLAQFAADNYDLTFLSKTNNVLNELGIYLCVQDDVVDYLDNFEKTDGFEKESDSSYSDIVRGGFTWLITQAMYRGNYQQKDILRQHYGKESVESVHRVNQVFGELEIFDLYQQFKKRSHDYVYSQTEKAEISKVHKDSILKFLELFYR